MRNSRWLRLLAYVTGSVNQELLLRNEYLAAENRILRAQLPSRLRLSNPERVTLAEIGKRLGRRALREVACVAKPDTILAWYRKLVAEKFDGSKHRQYPGRPAVSPEVEALIVRMARDNSITSRVLASPRPEDGGWEDVDWFIRTVKIWGYAGNPKSHVPPEKEDGILIYGGGHGIFAWESGRYVNGFQDRVDRDQ